MMVRNRLFPVAMISIALSACGDDSDGAPPVAGQPTTSISGGDVTMGAGTGSGTTSMGSTGGTGTATDGGSTGTGGGTTSMGSTGGTTNDGSTGGDGTSSTGGSTGGAVTDLLRGRFVDGSSGTYVPPFTCSVRFFGPGEIEPTTGVDTGMTLQQTFTVDSFPSDWVVTVDSAGGNIGVGDVGYVGAVCDVDGDLLNDDNVGGWYTAIPLTQITVPAQGLDISIADL